VDPEKLDKGNVNMTIGKLIWIMTDSYIDDAYI
jgi:hypothetical protein